MLTDGKCKADKGGNAAYRGVQTGAGFIHGQSAGRGAFYSRAGVEGLGEIRGLHHQRWVLMLPLTCASTS